MCTSFLETAIVYGSGISDLKFEFESVGLFLFKFMFKYEKASSLSLRFNFLRLSPFVST